MRRQSQLGTPTYPTNPVKIFSQPIPDGDAGVTQTIRLMKGLVYGVGGVRSPEVREAALEAVRGVQRGQHEIDSVYNWVKDNIEFRGEFGETLQEPRITLRYRAGDCDDQSMLTAALLASLGYETRFRTIALKASPDELSHVYLEVRDKQTRQWMPLDSTVANAYPGWQPQDVARTQTYGTMRPDNSSGKVLAGLGLLALFL